MAVQQRYAYDRAEKDKYAKDAEKEDGGSPEQMHRYSDRLFPAERSFSKWLSDAFKSNP
jgi:hypothetical protein